MRAAGLPVATLLLVSASLLAQVFADDIYWEGEEDASNEFLEVKDENNWLDGHLKRIKRQWFDPFNLFSSSTTAAPESFDQSTDPQPDESIVDPNDDDTDVDGSGSRGIVDQEPREKTLRVSFVVMHPYQKEYSNRDSPQFQNFSRSLANAVNKLYDGNTETQGTQRASLVRIQSRATDDFSCKVTLDIVTTGYDNTEKIKQILFDHIRMRRTLENLAVNDADFSAKVIDPGTDAANDLCEPDEVRCKDGTCVPGSVRCDGTQDCADGTDEADCSLDNNGWERRGDIDPSEPTRKPYQPEERYPVTVPPEQSTDSPWGDRECELDELTCDVTRCVPLTSRCDGVYDCTDRADELDCEEACGSDDFRCNNGKCISRSQKCDRITDCPSGEDEKGCVCRSGEFQCLDDFSCIEDRKRCDGINHCNDGSDETNCQNACTTDQWQCDYGNCIKRSQRCDGRVDCPTDRSDERNCIADDYFKCKETGKYIPSHLRCNRHYDCLPGDYSDEHNCPCGDGDFKCENGYCIPASKHCDRTHDCQDGSDERDCKYGPLCMAYQCSSGQCVGAEARCNGTSECSDGSDEAHCPCMRDQFQCQDKSCINIALRCDGQRNCPRGDDEFNCASQCSPEQFACPAGSPVLCAVQCDGVPECSDSADERDCPTEECAHECDGRCLDPLKICDKRQDCSDGSDEYLCNECDGPNDFRCDNGECIDKEHQCNGLNDCTDASDEIGCNKTIIPQQNCMENEFQCRDGQCINSHFRCDSNMDCNDFSDELNCHWPAARPSRSPARAAPCHESQFTCYNGRCIPHVRRCDNVYDCSDFSDEQNCYNSACDSTQWTCSSGQCVSGWARCNGISDCSDGSDEQGCIATTTRLPYTVPPRPAYPECDVSQFRCDSGQCISNNQYCDGYEDCLDRSDEIYCSTPAPLPTTQRYPPPRPPRPDVTATDRPRKCDAYQFRCDSGQCISNNQYCDGYDDCLDRSDEIYCSTPAPLPTTQRYPPTRPPRPDFTATDRPRKCISGEWECQDRCIPDSLVCNGFPDCPDNSDEIGCAGVAPTTRQPFIPPQRPSPGDFVGGCARNQWRCENGPCIDASRRCDGNFDCPEDDSDELDCPRNRPASLNLKTYPEEQTSRNGADVVFQCRDEGLLRAPVRWVREGGRPLKPGSIDRNGRLEMSNVTVSDSGVYICQAVKYLSSPGSQLKVQLTVQNSAPPPERPFTACKTYEATCGNGQCIPRSAICDGKIDCADKSDEETCHKNGLCEPNQFRCANNRCVLKTWVCDAEDDCGDNSDEQRCGPSLPGEACLPNEFTCGNNQCIPKSYQCDGQKDCMDLSDEANCIPMHIKRPPQPPMVRLNPGDTLTLECEVAGVPTPMVNWRLNWGHVPAKCSSTSNNGLGVLTCPNMEPNDSGAYSCEFINNRGFDFAVPDSIVYVNRTDPCPRGFFNSEARSESECIRCFCFGKSQQCKSADLFVYNMATPLGQGGTRLVGLQQTYNGEVRIDSLQNGQYYYQPLINGATVTKIGNYYPESSGTRSHPYLTLPETYTRKQLTSYGGHIRYTISPQSPRISSGYDNMPDIIIKGKYETLVYSRLSHDPRDTRVEVRLTPENWKKSRPNGLEPATREDVMMALDNIEMILLRASVNDVGVNITDFVMESAQGLDAGLGDANLIEECSCPPGYSGRSCEECSSGFIRDSSDPWLGSCVPEAPRPCPPGTYGDPARGADCRPCPCPLTNRGNQFARTCALGPRGNVVCDCNPGYQGDQCQYCASGYEGNPLVPGDSCRPAEPPSYCNPVGTIDSYRSRLSTDRCECKENVQGQYCDQCKDGSFHLSEDNRQGCALCFCTGVTQQCTSSNLRRKTTSITYNIPQIVEQVRVYESGVSPGGRAGAVRYDAPVEAAAQPELVSGELVLRAAPRSTDLVYYWSLPPSFAGDIVTSYGGYLRYVLRNAQFSGIKNNAANIQIISHNRLTFHYFGDFEPTSDGYLNATVQFLEKGWQRADGKDITRQHFLLALADVKAILVKATYTSNSQVATLVSSSIDKAEPGGDGPPAAHVEQCVCPPGYLGTSCEDCAPGYTRSSSGLYLELCEPCDCGGHTDMCDPETGVCLDCQDNTAGNKCEECKPGYERDPYNNCVLREGSDCRYSCDSRGRSGPCDARGICLCKQNVEGESCDRCRPGTFGLDEANPDGCIPCYCSGVTRECYETPNFGRIPIPAPIIGENNGDYIITDMNARRVINDRFVPAVNESELMYIFDFPPSEELYWSLPVFTGNMLLSYGGNLNLAQRFQSDSRNPTMSEPGTDVVLVGDELSVYWTNPQVFRSGQSLSYQVPLLERGWFILNSDNPVSRNEFMSVLKNIRRILVRATLTRNILSTSIADVSMDTAGEGYGPPIAKDIELCRCPPGYTGRSCESCAPGFYQRRGRCQQCECSGFNCHVDSYDEVVCDCGPNHSGPDCSIIDGDPLVTTSRPPPAQSTVTVTISSPTIRIVNVGGSVNFTCEARSRMSQRTLPVKWSKVDGYLPQGRSITYPEEGVLVLVQVRESDSGVYVCSTSDGVSTAQATATLTVGSNPMTIPTVSIRPSVNEYYEGDRITLECQTDGNPAPTVSWQRASAQPLPINSQSYDSYLIIDNAREEDGGEYRCIARNTAGATDRTAAIVVRPRPTRPSRERLTISPNAPNVVEGQSTNVICTGTTNIPAGSIGWVRQDGTDLLPNVRSDNGVLYIDVARLENNGVYICQTSSERASSVPIMVTVIPLSTPPPGDTPGITVNVKSLMIPTGETRTIECIPHGYPLPDIKWQKHQGTFGRSTSQRGNTLIIGNAQEEDRGYYQCSGSINGDIVADTYVMVDIETRIRPKVEIWPQGEITVPLGGEFEFQCRVVEGVPEPEILWSRGRGQRQQLSEHTQIKSRDILRFENIDVNDEGEYICSASNTAGSGYANATLKVRSPPEITLMPSSFVQVNLHDPLEVQCRARGYPDPEVSIESALDDRVLVQPSVGIATLSIQAASENDSGDYVCTATSPAGTVRERFAVRVERGDIGLGSYEGSGENEIDEPSSTNDNPEDMVAIQGQDSRLGCKYEDGYEVQWGRFDRQPLQRNAQQYGNELVIRGTSKADAGQYECTVIDPRSGLAVRSAYTRLRVMAPPRITLRPATQTVHPGQSPTVECVVQGDDIIETIWRPVDRPFSSRVQTRGNTLIFRHIEVEDAGKYECFARNLLASTSENAQVIVSEETDRAPSESHDNEQVAHAGAAVRFRCNATALQRVRWTKDGRALPRSVLQLRDGSLYIRLARISDSGQYVCHISDQYGRQTSNYINLHIEGIECLKTQFRCTDGTGCINDILLCDGANDCDDKSDEDNCIFEDEQSPSLSDYPTFNGPPEEVPQLVVIDQPGRQYRVDENVQVVCRAASKDVRVTWEKIGTQQHVNQRVYGDGSSLILNRVIESDAGVYRCTGQDRLGRTSYDDFTLVIQPGSSSLTYPDSKQNKIYRVHVGDPVNIPCPLAYEPASVQWTREFSSLPSDVRANEVNLYLPQASEADAGTYICTASDGRGRSEAQVVLLVTGVVPRFNGHSWLSMETLKDAFLRFDIEISFNPADPNGLILYNSENDGQNGDFLALQLVDAVPHMILETSSYPVTVKGDRPLQLNVWHTIRLSRIHTKVSMNVDDTGPFTAELSTQYHPMELKQPLYIGGVPDPYRQLPPVLANTPGFIGCVGMLVLGKQEKDIMVDSIEKYQVGDCDSCAPNVCLHGGICQEARNERGYVCLCPAGYAGQNCDHAGEGCRPRICGPGKCTETADSYKCSCPITFTGPNCNIQQSIEYPAFTGSAYLAIKTPETARSLHMSLKIKAMSPVADGIIVYCAESELGHGGFTALTVHRGLLEFRYQLGDGSNPVILTSRYPLPANEWVEVNISRSGAFVTLRVNRNNEDLRGILSQPKELRLMTALYVGGVDDLNIVLNNNTGVTGGFSGCIKDVTVQAGPVNIVNSSIVSANVQECTNYDRGDIPEDDRPSVCSRCQNGGYCLPGATRCTCPGGFAGAQCEHRAPLASPRAPGARDPCRDQPCKNRGTCRPDSRASPFNYTCDCPLGFAGLNCHIPYQLRNTVGFNGNGYVEIAARNLQYDSDPVVIALAVNVSGADGVLLYQHETTDYPGNGDYILLRVENGHVVFEWDQGDGPTTVAVEEVDVSNNDRHVIIVKLYHNQRVELTVDQRTNDETYKGLSNLMHADSNIYLGGIPERLNVRGLAGLTGCVFSVEFTDMSRALDLSEAAVAGRNALRCKERRP